MATLTPILVTSAGVDGLPATTPAASGGDKWTNTGSEYLWVHNDVGGSSIVLTFPIRRTIDGLSASSRTVTVLANTMQVIGPFPVGIYNDGSGFARVDSDTTSGVEISVLKFPSAK